MGLWDWFFGTPRDAKSTASGNAARTNVQPESSAVATIEPPAEHDHAEHSQATDVWWTAPEGALTELAETYRPELSIEARAFENYLVDNFDGHDLTMPPLPRVPERVLKALGNPNCNFNRVADEIAEDQVVAASLLRAVNSPLYRGASEITSLSLAAARLGVKALRTLMMHQSMRAATFLSKGGDKYLAELVWRRSVASACIMSGLAKFTPVQEDDAWLIGLLHDVGYVVVLRAAQANYKFTGYRIDPPAFEYLCHECHQEFGELIAEGWHMPPKLKALIASHHAYPPADDPLRAERLMLHATDMIASLLGYATPAPYDLLASRPVHDLGLAQRKDFISFLTDLPEQIQDAMIYF
ncbi:MAG: HDOD domain-containing protein [Phycisphaerae bacterium]|nr:HDOD domain-containing protein [Phycisphaerae bacterium]